MKECDTCQKVKITQPVRKGELHIIRRSRPNELITSDITGPFPLTKNGNLFILVKIFAFTKFAEIYAIPKTVIIPILQLFRVAFRDRVPISNCVLISDRFPITGRDPDHNSVPERVDKQVWSTGAKFDGSRKNYQYTF